MLVARNLEAPARHFPLNYPHYARILSLWLNPSSNVTWVADGHRGQSGLPDRVRHHQVKLLRYLLQRRPLRGPTLVADHAWMTLDRTFLMVFISLEGEDGLQFRMGWIHSRQEGGPALVCLMIFFL